MSWSMIRMVSPCAAMRLSRSCSSSFSVEFRPAAGSSSSSSVGLAGERARDLDQALVAVGEAGDQFVGARRRGRRRSAPPSPAPSSAAAPLGRSAYCPAARRRSSTFSSAVIERNSRMFWKVRPSPAAVRWCGGIVGDVGAVEHDLAGGRRVQARQHVERRGLARAVRPDQRMDAAAPAPSISTPSTALRPPKCFARPRDFAAPCRRRPARAAVKLQRGGTAGGGCGGAPALDSRSLTKPQMPSGMKQHDQDDGEAVDRQIQAGDRSSGSAAIPGSGSAAPCRSPRRSATRRRRAATIVRNTMDSAKENWSGLT